MNTSKALRSVLASLVLVLPLLMTLSVHATVGGDTLIYDFKYNPSDESVYYTRTDGSGRGCPPELRKVSLNSEKSTTVFSCDEGEKLSLEQVTSTINATTEKFKPLFPLSLKNNAIAIDVTFVKNETYDKESDEILMRHFSVVVYQHGKKVKEFPITGCTVDQPFTFQGYSIPGFDKKIIMLISAKSNCFEGGYISEALEVIGGVDGLDKASTGNFYKRPTPLLPNEGNLVIYESDTVSSAPPNPLPVSTSTPIAEPSDKQESFFARLLAWIKSLFSF